MGTFSDTTYTTTIENLVTAATERVNNPYYTFTDKTPTKVTYYIQNVEQTTIDQASGLYAEHIGSQSPIRFNKINSFYLYGITQISTDFEVGDYGTESSIISGDAYVLPNTIRPKPGDFFTIDYLTQPVIFKVNAVTPDTLDNGANIYKLEYALEYTYVLDSLEAQVIKTYNFVISNVGTEYSTLIEEGESDLASALESLTEQLITYFNNIFFDSRLQTFVFTYNGKYMYDPYLIEFLIRNKVMSYGDSYVYVAHAAHVGKTFGIEYINTIFKKIEDGSLGGNCYTQATADLITDRNSLFVTRMDYYYMIRYGDSTPYKTRFNTISAELLDYIESGTYYDSTDTKSFYNLWIAYFNGTMSDYMSGDILTAIKNAEYLNTMEHFYGLAITIFILENYINSLLT